MAENTLSKNIQDTIEYLGNIKTSLEDKGQDMTNVSVEEYSDYIGNLDNTSDATATANDILNPKTAYVNGQKITGNIMPVYDGTSEGMNINVSTTFNDIHLEGKVACKYSNSLFNFYRIENNTISSTVEQSYSASQLGITLSGTYQFLFASNLLNENQLIFAVNSHNGSSTQVATGILNLTDFSISNIHMVSYYDGRGDYEAFSKINGSNCEFFSSNIEWNDSTGYLDNIKYSLIYKNLSNYNTITNTNTVSTGTSAPVTGLYIKHYFSNNSGLKGNIQVIHNNNRYINIYITRNNALTAFSTTKIFGYNSNGYKYDVIGKNGEYVIYNQSLYHVSDLETPLSNLPFVSEKGKEIINIPNTNYFILKYNASVQYYKLENNQVVYQFSETSQSATRTGDVGNILISFNNGICYNPTTNKYITLIINNTRLIELQKENVVFYNTSDATITSDKVLINNTFFSNNGKNTGTMPNNGQLSFTPTDSQQTIPAGYTSGGTIAPMDITLSKDYETCLNLSNAIINHTVILPYIPIEYIQSTGNQFISINYLPKTLSTRYEIGYMRTGTNGMWNPIINSENDVRFGIMATTDGGTQNTHGQFHIGSSSSFQSVKFPISNNVKYDIVADKTGISLNNTKYSITGTVVSATGSWSTCINHRRTSASAFSSEYSLGRWYYLRIYENDELIREYVPAKRKSDNAVCLYEKINKVFYTNIGSGAFTAGAEI